jgi:DNA-binding PucR family transcriptional regulator
VARSRRSRATSAAVAARAGPGDGRVHRVESLLSGELLDSSRIPYDFDLQSVGLVAVGQDADDAVADWIRALGESSLIVRSVGGAIWGWAGRGAGFDHQELDALVTAGGGTRMAVGEPATGLAGWRLTHRQARAALPVALRGPARAVRYSQVAVLATVIRDELLTDSLRRIYIAPLEDGRDGGRELRRTLRAYFGAGRSVSTAGAELGVTRQAVSRRIRAAEQKLGRSISSCAADIEIALRLEALEETPTRL